MTAETKWTKGPWRADKNLGCKEIKGAKAGTHKQAQYHDIASTVGLWNDEEDRANANLIAAAPELYDALTAALKEVAFDARHDPNLDAVCRQIRAALAKARGEATRSATPRSAPPEG